MSVALIVDDSKVVRRVSRGIMEALGFTVMEAEDGQQALERCADQRPDVILLDWNMPVMNGMEFLHAFRQSKDGAQTKIIFCTTEHDTDKIMEALSCGADEYIMKPYDAAIVADKLAQLGLI